ncbi:MAG: diheme cytochrome c-553 [Ginsengibacter sp.]
MKKYPTAAVIISIMLLAFIFSQCNENESKSGGTSNQMDTSVVATSYGGFDSPVKWGEHLVILGGCNDCHTPKKMTAMGPMDDSSLLLSGHPANMPPPDVDRKDLESKGISATSTLTAWVGPWGISYAANLTPDSTGIGNWTEDQFLLCLRQGKAKGIATNRQLLPPMPWRALATLSDDELKAIFAYLKSNKPIKNIVPAAAFPVLMKHN